MRHAALTALLVVLSLCAGCGAGWSSRAESEPFAPESVSSDMVFVRTGDRRYYYVIDKKRRACFFHARLYGKKHLVPMDCEQLPEFRRLVGDAEPHPGEHHDEPHHTGPHLDEAPMDEPIGEAPVDEAPPGEPGGITDGDREAFRRAYVQKFCAQRAGYEEPMPILLSRHGLTQEQWDQIEAELSADRAAWDALTAEATAACP